MLRLKHRCNNLTSDDQYTSEDNSNLYLLDLITGVLSLVPVCWCLYHIVNDLLELIGKIHVSSYCCQRNAATFFVDIIKGPL